MNENEDETLLNFVKLLLQRNPAKRDLD